VIHRTPVTDMALYDGLPSALAVANAWRDPGRNPIWHSARQADVRSGMPLLARALDRLADDVLGDAP